MGTLLNGKSRAWTDGVRVFMRRDGSLGDCCYRCGAPSRGFRVRCSFRSADSSVLPSPDQPALFVFEAVRNGFTVNVDVPLCPAHRRSRILRLQLMWTLIALVPVCVVTASDAGDYGTHLAFAALGFASLAFVVGFTGALVRNAITTGDVVIFRGAGRGYLEQLPSAED